MGRHEENLVPVAGELSPASSVRDVCLSDITRTSLRASKSSQRKASGECIPPVMAGT